VRVFAGSPEDHERLLRRMAESRLLNSWPVTVIGMAVMATISWLTWGPLSAVAMIAFCLGVPMLRRLLDHRCP
jgi:hypothetical protein